MTRTFQLELHPVVFHRVERRAERDDRRLVVRRGPRVEAPFAAELGDAFRVCDLLAAAIDTSCAKNRCERIGLSPGLRVYRLTVVVAVEEQGRRRARHTKIAVDQRVARRLEDLGRETARREHAAEVFGIATDVGAIGGDVRDREQIDQLADDRLLMTVNPLPDNARRAFSVGVPCESSVATTTAAIGLSIDNPGVRP